MAPPVDTRRVAYAEWVRAVLRRAKEHRKLSVVAIAEMAGIGNPTIYRWAKAEGKELPNPEQVLAFCDALDIDPQVPFGILWPGKSQGVAAPEPIYMDADYRQLMRKLHDPNVDDFEKEFIRETMRQLVDRPPTRARHPKRTRPRSAN